MTTNLTTLLLLASTAILPSANDAWTLALADARTLPPEVRCHVRYVWSDSGDMVDAKEVAIVWNRVSRSTNLYRPVILGKDKLIVSRIDLCKTAPLERDLIQHLELWENFRNDPQFSRLLTKDTIKFNNVFPETTRWETETVPAYVHSDGKTYTSKWVRKKYTPTAADLENVDLIRFPSIGIDPEVYRELCELTGSEAPVVSHPYFVLRTMRSIKDDGLFRELFGGLYYDFGGYKRNVKGKTDLDGIFESIGIQNVKRLFDDLRSDEKIAIFRSKVTGKPRAVSIFHSPSGRNGSGTVRISEDLRDKDIDIGSHPLMNLLKRKFAGQELIFEKPNGMHAFAALNGEGKLVDEVPFDIALDTTIEAPHSRRLDTMSCAGCHAPADGVQPLTNDARKLLKYLIDGDAHAPDIIDNNDRTKGLYSGDPSKLLSRVRERLCVRHVAGIGTVAQLEDGADRHRSTRGGEPHKDQERVSVRSRNP